MYTSVQLIRVTDGGCFVQVLQNVRVFSTFQDSFRAEWMDALNVSTESSFG